MFPVLTPGTLGGLGMVRKGARLAHKNVKLLMTTTNFSNVSVVGMNFFKKDRNKDPTDLLKGTWSVYFSALGSPPCLLYVRHVIHCGDPAPLQCALKAISPTASFNHKHEGAEGLKQDQA